MRGTVIHLFEPGPEAGIEVAQVTQAGGVEIERCGFSRFAARIAVWISRASFD